MYVPERNVRPIGRSPEFKRSFGRNRLERYKGRNDYLTIVDALSYNSQQALTRTIRIFRSSRGQRVQN